MLDSNSQGHHQLMSQVIIEEDQLKEKRLKTREQERRIDRESVHAKWQIGGTAGLSFIARAAGIALLPVALLWAGFIALISLAFRIVGRLFQVLGKLVGGERFEGGLHHPKKDNQS